MKCFNLEYDVVLSFAGEDRKYVQKVADSLKKEGVKVFYDEYEETNLWGKDLYQHLDDVYQNKGKYAVLFISEHYSKKLWTNHELKSAQARAFSENQEYILPARFDDTAIPGLRNTVGYISLTGLTPAKFAKKIIDKLGYLEPVNFLPEQLNFANQILQSIYEISLVEIEDSVQYVFEKLKLTNSNEKTLLTYLSMYTCSRDITEDFHHDISFVERVSGLSREEIITSAKSLSNLGFEYKIERSHNGCDGEYGEEEREILHLKLMSLQPKLPFFNLTIVLYVMYYAVFCNRCEYCRVEALSRLDFTDIKQTAEEEEIEQLIDILPFEDEDNN